MPLPLALRAVRIAIWPDAAVILPMPAQDPVRTPQAQSSTETETGYPLAPLPSDCRDIIYVLNLLWHLYALDIISSAESFKINTSTLIQLDNILDKYNKSTFWRLTINDCNKFSERIKSGGWSHQNKTPPSDLQCSGCARRANWKIHDTSFWPDMQAMFDDVVQSPNSSSFSKQVRILFTVINKH